MKNKRLVIPLLIFFSPYSVAENNINTQYDSPYNNFNQGQYFNFGNMPSPTSNWSHWGNNSNHGFNFGGMPPPSANWGNTISRGFNFSNPFNQDNQFWNPSNFFNSANQFPFFNKSKTNAYNSSHFQYNSPHPDLANNEKSLIPYTQTRPHLPNQQPFTPNTNQTNQSIIPLTPPVSDELLKAIPPPPIVSGNFPLPITKPVISEQSNTDLLTNDFPSSPLKNAP